MSEPKKMSVERLQNIRCLADGDSVTGVWLTSTIYALLDHITALEADLTTAREEGRRAGIDEAAKVCDREITHPVDCEKMLPMDMTTGVVECALEIKGGNCLCAEQMEAAERIAAAIRALKPNTEEKKG